jgi:phage terminase large subunit-like protein
MPREDRELILSGLPDGEVEALLHDWPAWAHEGQRPPDDDDWRVWVLLAGRGFGKTKAGAEWVAQFAREHPDARIALVAATPLEGRRVMVEGRSGLLAVAGAREPVWFEPSQSRLRFASGAQAFLYSAANPEALRGPEHHIAWCDELAKWPRAQAVWDNLQLGLRLSEHPRALVTTTPRPVPALKSILGEEGIVQTGGGSRANPHLPDRFLQAVERRHAGTRFGRQELDGVLIEELEGALWSRETLERCRSSPCERAFRRVVVGVDPPASAQGDECGIVVCALGEDGLGYVLADLSRRGLSPDGWARKVAAAAEAYGASRVVAEKNNGGAMVETVLRGASVALPVKLVHAVEGKAVRAEPVAALFEGGRARLEGGFPELEDQLCGLMIRGGYEGPGRSPDRADAMVYALTELMLGPTRGEPRVRML